MSQLVWKLILFYIVNIMIAYGIASERAGGKADTVLS